MSTATHAAIAAGTTPIHRRVLLIVSLRVHGRRLHEQRGCRVAHQHLVDDSPQRVHVTLRSDLALTRRLLRTHVLRRAEGEAAYGKHGASDHRQGGVGGTDADYGRATHSATQRGREPCTASRRHREGNAEIRHDRLAVVN